MVPNEKKRLLTRCFVRDGHIIVLDIYGINRGRMVNLYRPFNPRGVSELTFGNTG